MILFWFLEEEKKSKNFVSHNVDLGKMLNSDATWKTEEKNIGMSVSGFQSFRC